MSNENRNPNPSNDRKNLDHPEQYPTDKKSLFDQFESQQHVDPIPMEDLKQELRDEKNKHKSKNDSSSAQKYK
ncbi:hypothetical protein [Halalkalibacter alkalisediminis]|uniref:Uncharacterized protein n=1 Tax=Halalkalibacter alkalisediminis TaxID=935616 RepID=A0ABV6NAJ0_9BACI|nr:hypothetical protein [Halalkalibacter alkalisediminis]